MASLPSLFFLSVILISRSSLYKGMLLPSYFFFVFHFFFFFLVLGCCGFLVLFVAVAPN